jgi:hypothetical protein
MVCDNEAAVKPCNQKLTSSIYHTTESDWDLLKTYHILRDEWCRDIPTKAQWMKRHADREERELAQEWADLLADEKRAKARAVRGKTKLLTLASGKSDPFYSRNMSDKWHETATSITALRWAAERLYHQQGKVDTMHLRQRPMVGLRNSV